MTSRPAARARELAVNARLMASTAAAHLGEDPLLLALQTSRRLPPRWVARVAPALTRTARGHDGVRTAWAAWSGGHPDDAAGVLERLSAAPRTRLRGRVLAELAVQVARPDLVEALVASPSTPLRARSAWSRGDSGLAVDLLAGAEGDSLLAAGYRSALTLQAPGTRLVPPRLPRGTGRGSPTTGAPAAFHVLTNSLPHSRSGYTVRSHAVLRAQAAAGIRVAAATRLAYPVSIGVLRARRTDVVDGVAYQRVLPPVLPRPAVDRLQRQVDLLAPVVAGFAPTVLHTTTDFTNALVTRALAEALGVPWVYEVRGLLEDTWVASRATPSEQAHAAGSDRYRALRAREVELACAADHVVTLGETLRDELVSRGVDGARLTVVPNAVDPALLLTDLDAPTARRAVGLPAEGFWVGTLSSLVDYEGLDTLLTAVAALRRRGVDARACIVGDGVARARLEQQTDETGLRDHVVFTGRVPLDRTPLHHQALDVFVTPRRDLRVCRMVTPLKPIEAMACGRPVVASDLPGLAEIVRAPGSGVLTPAGDVDALADALADLARAPRRRAELGAAGRAFAATRTWASAGETYRDVYASLQRVTA